MREQQHMEAVRHARQAKEGPGETVLAAAPLPEHHAAAGRAEYAAELQDCHPAEKEVRRQHESRWNTRHDGWEAAPPRPPNSWNL
eukprot:gene3005-585_t